jgi:hypothetical protein
LSFRDNIPVINLVEWPLEAAMFDGDACAGMFPAIFSEDPEATAEALIANPVTAHKDLQRAAKTFFMPETLDLEEAFTMLKKPRYFKSYISTSKCYVASVNHIVQPFNIYIVYALTLT